MKDRDPQINISSIRVGGDLAGLVFVAGSVAILVGSLTPLRWFFGASIFLAGLLAAFLIHWRRTH